MHRRLFLSLAGAVAIGSTRPTRSAAWSTAQADPRFDAMGSIAIGLLLGVIAIFLASEMKSLLIGESATPAANAAIMTAIEAQEGVLRVIHLRTQHIGPEEILVGSKVAIETHYTLPDVARCIDAIEAAIRERVPDARVIYIEPDLLRETATSE